MDLNLLRVLVALVEERSTVKAARRLFLSQPTISGALGRLRQALGDQLLVRNGRALEPTTRAIELVAAVKPHLEGLGMALAGTLPFDPEKDRRAFRLGCTDAVALAALPRLTLSLRQKAPSCDLVVRVGDYRTLPGMLASGEISTALGYLRDDPPASAKVQVLRHASWVVLRDERTAPIVGMEDYCARPHALVTPLGDLTGLVDQGLGESGRSRRVAVGVSSFALLLGVLPGSDIVATVPDFVAAPLAAMGKLAIQPCPLIIPPVPNRLAWRATSDRDSAETWFREQVREAFASSPG